MSFRSSAVRFWGAELRSAYSPDMNPIEKAFSKLKAFLRKFAERTVGGLIRALETCAEIFKPSQCTNYFKSWRLTPNTAPYSMFIGWMRLTELCATPRSMNGKRPVAR